MSPVQIEMLTETVRQGHGVVWNPDEQTCRKVIRVGEHADEGAGEPCAIFANGDYAALFNANAEDFYFRRPVFHQTWLTK